MAVGGEDESKKKFLRPEIISTQSYYENDRLVFFIRSDFCLSFARLSLAWLFALGRLLT
jgi:hypothetical protein